MLNDFWLRVITIILFLILHGYWRIAEKGFSYKAFKFESASFQKIFRKSALSYFQFFLFLQLGGLKIFPTPHNIVLQELGVLLAFLGLVICILARKSLGANWTNAKDFQAKNKFTLVTQGIYKYIRHPIYFGVGLMLTGGEIVAESYLIVFLLVIYVWIYKQAIKEENFLLEHLGERYQEYKKKTKMFIPYLI